MSENNLKMSSSPHIRSKATTSNIMMLVAIALLPASAFGVWNFGLPAFGMLVTTTVVAVLTEYIYEKLMHKKITINDWSAAVTGLLLGLNMPPTAPWWMGAIGSVFAILIVKQLFGAPAYVLPLLYIPSKMLSFRGSPVHTHLQERDLPQPHSTVQDKSMYL